jgi:catalase
MNNNASVKGPLGGQEHLFPGEDGIIAEMIAEMEEELQRLYVQKKMLRQIHTKMHGCVVATFSVVPGLAEEYKVGVFKDEKTYPVWIRFSNSNSIPKPDKKKDIRGIAVKLMNVPGDKLLNDEFDEKTQDFLLMSSETFFARNLVEFRKLLKASTSKNKLKLVAFFLNPLHLPILLRVKRSMIACRNPFEINYWSTQAYQFGKQNMAVKYKIEPASDNKLFSEDVTTENYLRNNMVETLKRNPVNFNFYIQLQTDPANMPVEDPTKKWNSTFVKVAEIHIRQQEFDTPAQMEFGDNLSFNSWHSLPEHRPLGSFNRARKRVYETLSKFRHNANKLPVFEPQPVDEFATESKTGVIT